MSHFFLKRILSFAITLWMTLTLSFFILHHLPGDPVMGALNQSTLTQTMIELRAQSLHLDEPLLMQYSIYFRDLFELDLGVSWSGGMPVADLLRDALPHTIALTLAAFLVSWFVGFAIGIPQGLRKKRSLPLEVVSVGLLSIPSMLIGTFLILIFSVILPMLPSSGQGGTIYLILPALTAGLSISGSISRWVESSIRENKKALFIKLAEAKGLTRMMLFFRHNLRVSLLPLINSGLMLLSFLFSGTVVTESLFARSGLGRILVKSILESDVPVVQASVALSAVFYLSAALLADVMHALLDPRIRSSMELEIGVL